MKNLNMGSLLIKQKSEFSFCLFSLSTHEHLQACWQLSHVCRLRWVVGPLLSPTDDAAGIYFNPVIVLGK